MSGREPWFSAHRTRGLWWFRILGWGLHWKDSRIHRPLFSERNGYDRRLAVGPWRFKFLGRAKPTNSHSDPHA